MAREIRNRNDPFLAKATNSKAVFEKHKATPEFQGMTCDEAFQRRLVSLQKQVKEKEEDDGVDWDGSAAKTFLKDQFEDGVTPLDCHMLNGEKVTAGKEAKDVWEKHCANHPAFEGMVQNSIFQWRLEAVTLNHNSKKRRATDDLEMSK